MFAKCKKKRKKEDKEEDSFEDVDSLKVEHTAEGSSSKVKLNRSTKTLVTSAFGQSVLPAQPAKTTATCGSTSAKPHPKGSQQARAQERKAEKTFQRTEKAMSAAVENSPVKQQKGFQLFERPQPKVRDYVAIARIKASKLSPVQVIPYEFFHQEKQYKFDDFVKALRSYNVEFFKHPRENKVKVCFMGTDVAVHADEGWIDTSHVVQNEMGQSAGWFFRIKQFFEEHGAVEKKQAKEAKEESVKPKK